MRLTLFVDLTSLCPIANRSPRPWPIVGGRRKQLEMSYINKYHPGCVLLELMTPPTRGWIAQWQSARSGLFFLFLHVQMELS